MPEAALVIVLHSEACEGRRAGVRGRRRGGPRGRAGRALRPARHPARAVDAAGLRRRAHRLRHRPARPARRRLAAGAAGHPRGDPRRARARDRAVRRPGVLRRRPGGVRGGPPAERAHLAAAGRARAPARVRLGRRVGGAARRRRRGGRRRARRDLPDRERHADEHLRAQPRDAPRARPRASTTRC